MGNYDESLPVVTGTVVNNSTKEDESDFSGKGEKQTPKCRDPIFALLLYINVAAIAAVVGVYGVNGGTSDAGDTDEDTTIEGFEGYIYVAIATGAFGLLFSALSLMVLMRIPQILIKTSLIMTVVLSGVWAAIAFAAGNLVGGIIGAIIFALSCCYAYSVWSRIPFATANLVTACKAVSSNCGITIAAYFFAALSFAWSVLWSVAIVAVQDRTTTCVEDENGIEVCESINPGFLFLLFLSFFFTQQVIQNTLHVSVAGVVGTWWFSPDDNGCCSSAVTGSMIRSLTTSFGSICFGSLIVAIIQALRQLANQMRQQDDGILLCLAECILSCLESIVEYFNKWAYVYVGIYGYSYLEAGKNVMTLFKNRGWEAIIADDLVSRTLFLLSLVVGGVAGGVGAAAANFTDWFDGIEGNTSAISFFIGFLIGLVLASILMSVIGSGVNTVIVLFAEAPAEFQANYPELSNKMREAWQDAYPGLV